MNKSPNREAMAKAIADFLQAAGLDLADPNILDTPNLVAKAWAEELIAGHFTEPGEILSQTTKATHHEPVVLNGISFVGVCPHHLLPYEGRAHIAYLPGDKVAGFGSLVRLVVALGARLVLQEDLAQDIVKSLMDHLGAKGAGCLIQAKQGCVCLRGVRQPEVQTTTSAWAGTLADSRCNERQSIEISFSSNASTLDKHNSL